MESDIEMTDLLLLQVKENGGLTIVQDPEECQVRTMTSAAISATNVDHVLKVDEIINFLLGMYK